VYLDDPGGHLSTNRILSASCGRSYRPSRLRRLADKSRPNLKDLDVGPPLRPYYPSSCGRDRPATTTCGGDTASTTVCGSSMQDAGGIKDAAVSLKVTPAASCRRHKACVWWPYIPLVTIGYSRDIRLQTMGRPIFGRHNSGECHGHSNTLY